MASVWEDAHSHRRIHIHDFKDLSGSLRVLSLCGRSWLQEISGDGEMGMGGGGKCNREELNEQSGRGALLIIVSVPAQMRRITVTWPLYSTPKMVVMRNYGRFIRFVIGYTAMTTM